MLNLLTRRQEKEGNERADVIIQTIKGRTHSVQGAYGCKSAKDEV